MPVVYRVNTSKITSSGVHAHLSVILSLMLYCQHDIASNALRLQVLKSVGLILFSVFLIGLPFAYIFHHRVSKPIKTLIKDMTEFAEDPINLDLGGFMKQMKPSSWEAQQALNILQTATRRELVQRDKLASSGEAVTK